MVAPLLSKARPATPIMLEAKVEAALKQLESWGFKCLKLKTPGNSGVMDRMILAPKWSPAPPSFVELKAPGKEPRPLQAATAQDWQARGCTVYEYCDTIEKVEVLCAQLLVQACWDYFRANVNDSLPSHIQAAYGMALSTIQRRV